MGLMGSENISQAIIGFLTYLPGLLIAISFHELAHGYMAYLQGDDTAKLQGRLTIDPLAHIDPIGFLMLIFVGFGWAKPVQINYNNLKNGRLSVFLVSIAGVTVNFIIAFLATFLLLFLHNIGAHPIIFDMVRYLVMFNIVLGVFNLIPIPPLDGSKALGSLLPYKWELKLMQFERYGYIFLIVLLITGGISKILGPIVYLISNLFINIASIII
ncbi:MAG: site-2 protease family protein [Andreesenia angusta]|nr:site-2 protease family protein [Andreesenia angusta]